MGHCANLAHMSIKLIFYGLPGAGKDTQAAKLAEMLGVASFSAGQIMRDEVAAGTELGKIIKPHAEAGTLVPNGVAAQILRGRLLDPTVQSSGYIVNGYPRTVESLQTYLGYDRPSGVVHLIVPDEVARERLMARGRGDDTPELIEKRIRRYYETEKAAAEYVRDNTDIPLIEVDGTLSSEEVTKIILEQLDL